MAREGCLNLDPELVPVDDSRVRAAVLVANAAWLRSTEPTTAGRLSEVVRTVLGHIDDTNKDR